VAQAPSGSSALKLGYVNPGSKEITEKYFHPEITKQLCNKGFVDPHTGQFLLTKKAAEKESGRHVVMSATVQKPCGSELTIFIKLFPDLPFLEAALSEFALLLIGSHLPWIKIVKIEQNGRWIPAIIQEGVLGTRFDLAPSGIPFSLKAFSRQMILSIFAGSEDGKPDNYILTADGELIPIDFDRSFFPEYVKGTPTCQDPKAKNSEGSTIVNKDLIFLCDEMIKSLSPVVRDIIQALDPLEVLEKWIQFLEALQEMSRTLFTEAEVAQYFPKSPNAKESPMEVLKSFFYSRAELEVSEESVLRLHLPVDIIHQIFGKFRRIKRYLDKFPNATHWDLLKCTLPPDVSNYYGKFLKYQNTPYDRFILAFGKQYGFKGNAEETSMDLLSIPTILQSLTTLHGKPVDLAELKISDFLVTCKRNLEVMREQWKSWQCHLRYLAYEETTALDVLDFLNRVPEKVMEEFLRKLDFRTIIPHSPRRATIETRIFQILQRNLPNMCHCYFLGCSVLDSDTLSELLKNWERIMHLTITKCLPGPAEGYNNIVKCLSQAPSLSKITLEDLETEENMVFENSKISNLWNLFGTSRSTFENLQRLTISNCPVTEITIKVASIKVLRILNCKNLRRLRIFGCPNLSEISLDGSTGIEKFNSDYEFAPELRKLIFPPRPPKFVLSHLTKIPINPKTIKVWCHYASQGIQVAQMRLGKIYSGVEKSRLPRDMPKAIMWYNRAANQGHPESFFPLALLYEENFEWTKAAEFLERACGVGNSEAMWKLGNYFFNGTARPKDRVRALNIFREAGRKNHLPAQLKLGDYLKRGSGQEQKEAAEWYEAAASQGSEEAMYGLGEMFENLGKWEGALAWYKKAGEKNNHGALLKISKIFEEGRLGRVDLEKAKDYLQKARRLGCREAVESLERIMKKISELKNMKKERRNEFVPKISGPQNPSTSSGPPPQQTRGANSEPPQAPPRGVSAQQPRQADPTPGTPKMSIPPFSRPRRSKRGRGTPSDADDRPTQASPRPVRKENSRVSPCPENDLERPVASNPQATESPRTPHKKTISKSKLSSPESKKNNSGPAPPVQKDPRALIQLAEKLENSGGPVEAILQLVLEAVQLGCPEAWLKLARICLGQLGQGRDLKRALVYFKNAANLGNTEACIAISELETDPAIVEKYLLQAALTGYSEAQYRIGLLYLENSEVTKKQEGLKFLQAAAISEHPEALTALTQFFINHGGTKNLEKALAMLTIGEDDPQVKVLMGSVLIAIAAEDGDERRIEEAKKIFREAANEGETKAKALLAYLLQSTNTEEISEILRLYESAARDGDPLAQCCLAEFFYFGLDGVKPDKKMAWHWFYEAARQEYELAELFLGIMVEAGEGEEQDNERAASYYIRAAKKGNAEAMFRLARMVHSGRGVPEPDVARAIPLYRQASELGHAKAQNSLGLIYLHGNGVPKNEDQALNYFHSAAQLGDPEAASHLGRILSQGKIVEKDTETAIELLEFASCGGSASARAQLGLMYSLGEGVKVNKIYAADLFEDAARDHDLSGLCNSGLANFFGEGTTRDLEKSKKAFREAADEGSVEALVGLAFLYLEEEGSASHSQAFKCFKEASKRGHALASLRVGILHRAGKGTPVDKKKACKYFLKAGQLEDSDGYLNLGVMQETGEGIPENIVLALENYSLAAEKGNPRAQYNLGRYFFVKRNYPSAFSWFTIASKNSEESDALLMLGWMYRQGLGTEPLPPLASKYFKLSAKKGNVHAMLQLGNFFLSGQGVLLDPKRAVKWYTRAAEAGSQEAEKVLRSRGEALRLDDKALRNVTLV
jgi:TPR repeat protein